MRMYVCSYLCISRKPAFFHRTWCSGTAASARWSRYLAEQDKTMGCHSCQETATLSWRLSVLEPQTDNWHVNTVNRNRTIKDHDAPECWICAMKSGQYLAANAFTRHAAWQHRSCARTRNVIWRPFFFGRYQNLVQHKHVTSKQPAYDAKWSSLVWVRWNHVQTMKRYLPAIRSDAKLRKGAIAVWLECNCCLTACRQKWLQITQVPKSHPTERNMSHQSSRLTMPSGYLTQVPKSHPTQTCHISHIKAAGLRCQVVMSCLSAMQSSLVWVRCNHVQCPVISLLHTAFWSCQMWCDVCWLRVVVSLQCDCMFSKCDVMCGGCGVIAVWLKWLQMTQTQKSHPSKQKHVTVSAKVQVPQQTKPNAMRATPATQSDVGCQRHQSQPNAMRATHAMQSDGGCHQVPRLPRKVQLHVSKCCACHSKCSYMSPSATPAMQNAAAPRRHT